MSLQLEQVDLWRDGVQVLRSVSLQILPGEIHAVLGANGAGKSSILQVLAGDLKPANGRVSLQAQALAQYDATRLARQRAVLEQASMMDFDFSVRDLLGLGRLPHALADTPTEHAAAVAWALAQCDLEPLAARPVTHLSGGQQQRAHIARVLAQLYPLHAGTPRYALLDEPTAGLDLRHALSLLQRLRALAAQGLGVLWISHDINLAARFSDTVTLLADGEVIAQGAPGTALNADSLARCYGLPLTPIDNGKQRLWVPEAIDSD